MRPVFAFRFSDPVRPARLSLNLQTLKAFGRLDGFTHSAFRNFGIRRGRFLRGLRQDAGRERGARAGRVSGAADDCVYDGLRP